MKRIRMCCLCPSIRRESMMYTIHYTGWMRQNNSDAFPQTWITEERMLVCWQCYEKAGYVVRRKAKPGHVPIATDFPIVIRRGDAEYALGGYDPQTGDTIVKKRMPGHEWVIISSEEFNQEELEEERSNDT